MRGVVIFMLAMAIAALPVLADDKSQAERDADRLAEAFLPIAKDVLAKAGSFFPFGGAMTPADEMDIFSAGDTGTDEDEILATLTSGFKVAVAEGRYKAVAIIGDVTVKRTKDSEPGSAILMQIEHRDGYCVDAFWPYSLSVNGEAISVRYGTPWRKARKGTIFSTCRASQAPTVEQLQKMLDDMKNETP